MDYFIDFYDFGQDNLGRRVMHPAFVYDDQRSCSKIYTIFKLMGLLFYSATLSTCNKSYLYYFIIILKLISTLNCLRYEHSHYRRYGTVFLSISEFERWKNEQLPKSKAFFSIAELAIKLVFFVNTFPPQFEFRNFCNAGESMLKIHFMSLSIIYIILGVFSCCILFSFSYNDMQRMSTASSIQLQHVSLLPIITVTNNQNEECCICLETDTIQPWSMLPCGHKFHGSCVSTWLNAHHTCPVCRFVF